MLHALIRQPNLLCLCNIYTDVDVMIRDVDVIPNNYVVTNSMIKP